MLCVPFIRNSARLCCESLSISYFFGFFLSSCQKKSYKTIFAGEKFRLSCKKKTLVGKESGSYELCNRISVITPGKRNHHALMITRTSIIRFLPFLLFFTMVSQPVFATHIVGGIISYTYINDSTYTITLKLYRDCCPTCANLPDPVTIQVQQPNGSEFNPSKDITIPLGTVTNLPSGLDSCALPPNPMPCTQEAIYTVTVNNLQPNPGGYHIYFQYCCRNLTTTNADMSCNCTGESFYTFLPGTTPVWVEYFNLANGTTTDNGTTAWSSSTGAPPPSAASVNGNLFRTTGADDGQATWTSEYIDISAFPAGVDVKVDLAEQGDLDNDDSIRVYYRINNGPPVLFSNNGFKVNDFTTAMASDSGLTGDSIQIIVQFDYGATSPNTEIYSIDNVSVALDDFQSNSAPVFNLFPPLFLCVGENFTFDHSATDADGDSLVYSFYNPYTDDPPTFPSNQATFTPITWIPGYSSSSPLNAGGPSLSLSSSTGLLTGTAFTLGQYIVGIKVSEYRNGILISEVVRDFQFNIATCFPSAQAEIDSTGDLYVCNGAAMNFPNQSDTSANNWWWNFGDPATLADTSIAEFPSWSYSDTGDYNVMLIINKGTACADTAYDTVHVSWITAAFAGDTLTCAGDTVNFTDLSAVSSNSFISSWNWDFGDGFTSTQQNPVHIFQDSGTYNVTLVVSSGMGCTDTFIAPIVVDFAPVFVLDLTGNPDSVWTSPTVKRGCQVCGAAAPDVCVTFIVTLDPGTQMISFNISSGAIPPGALYYEISCANPTEVGDSMCVTGPGPHQITFCKPGNNPNTYSISAISPAQVSPDIVVTDACIDTLSVTGLKEGTIVWSSVPFNATYNSYLNCTVGCDTVIVTAQPGYPPYVDYEVSGSFERGCDTLYFRDTVRVYFVSSISVNILPQNPTVCFGGTNTTITANGIGGAPPYSYLWSNGATTSSISVGAGAWFVTMVDTTACPPVYDSVTVTAFASPITANAGSDQTVCANPGTVTLNGAVTGTTSGIWTTNGTGTFSPYDTSLNATYSASAADTFSGSVILQLTTTNNGTCPPDSDSVLISFQPEIFVNAGPDQVVCANNATVLLNGSVTGSTTTGIWSTSGTGTFSPINTSLTAAYNPSSADTGGGSITITLTSTNNGVCSTISDNLLVTITDAPVAVAVPDQVVCANNSDVSLNGTIYGGAVTGIWTTTGTGIFSPNDSSLTATYLPSASDTATGSVTITLTSTNNGACIAVNDAMVVTITDAPAVNAGTGQTICAGINGISLNGYSSTSSGQWTSSGSGLFSPNDTSLNTTYIPSVADTAFRSVTLTLTSTNNGNCIAVSDTINFILVPVPVVNAGPDQSVCAGSSASLSGYYSGSAAGAVWSTNGSGIFSPYDTLLSVTYTPSQADTLAGNIYIMLSSVNPPPCAQRVDSLLLTITPNLITVDAGPDDTTICSPGIILTGNVTVASGGLWSTTGTGSFFPSDTSFNTMYTFSPADTAAGSILLVLTTTGNGGCPPRSDSMNITIISNYIIVAVSAPDSVCSNDFPVPMSAASSTLQGLWSTTGSGWFSPSDTVMNVDYYPSVADTTAGSVTVIFTSTDNGQCAAVSDSAVTTLLTGPSVNAGQDQSVCATNPMVNLIGTVSVATGMLWSTDGSGNFSPDDTSVNVTYYPSPADTSAGSVLILLTTTGNGLCSAVEDSLIITYTPDNITADAGNNNSVVCAMSVSLNGSVTIATGGIWSTSGTGTFTPNDTSLVAVYNFSSADTAAGSVQLVLTTTGNGGCAPKSDTVNISIINTWLNATVSSVPAGCFGGSNGSAVITVTSGTPPYTYLWDSLAGSQTDSMATGLSAGTYEVIITDSNGCVDSSLTATVSQPSPLLIDSFLWEDVLCYGDSSASASAFASGGSPPYSYLWSNGDTTVGSGQWAAGNYTITVTDTNGCSIIDSVTITQPAELIADIFVSYVSCYSDSDGVAGITPLGGTPPYSFLWSTGLTTSAIINLPSSTYSVTLTDSVGCTDTVSVIVNQPPQLTILISDSDITCFGDSSASALAFASGGTPPYSYLWSNGDTTPGSGQWAVGNYTITVTDFNNCSVSDSVSITQPPPVAVTAIGIDTICPGNSATISAAGSGGISPYSYIWNQSLGTGVSFTVAPVLTTTYSVTATDNNGCTTTDSVTVFVSIMNPSGLDVISGGNVCEGNLTTINCIFNEEFPPYSYIWSNGMTIKGPFYVTVSGINVYSVTVTDFCGNTISDSVVVSAYPYPVIMIPPVQGEGCMPLSLSFTDPVNINATHLWDFGDGTTSTEQSPSHTYPVNGSYIVSVTVTSSDNCTSADDSAAVITVRPLPQPDCSADPEKTDIKKPTVKFSTGTWSSYYWNFGDSITDSLQNPVHIYTDTGTYNVLLTVTNEYNCTAQCQVTVRVGPDWDIRVPNVFTPDPNGSNGGVISFTDFSNDVFFPVTRYVQEFHMMIFNRWGEMVFETIDVKKGWDGYYRGKLLQQDVYVWKVRVKFADDNNTVVEKMGDVTLLR
ncbi:MAG: PKD domain-containing protein [Bacteroidetes bacterium]|nr:PKD domain-containing protein [Bacteroidota bacterium]